MTPRLFRTLLGALALSSLFASCYLHRRLDASRDGGLDAPIVDAGLGDVSLVDAPIVDARMRDLGVDLGGDAGECPVGGCVVPGSTYIKASNTGADDHFGFSLSLSADGMRLAVGAPDEDSSATGIDGDQVNDGAVDSGAVYVFAWSGETWTQEAYVKASNTDGGDEFGASVSLSADGARLAVGAPYEDSSATGIDRAADGGAVYVFWRTGTTWTQDAYVKASNTTEPGVSYRYGGDEFGRSVSLSADGTRLAVGARSEDSRAIGIGGDQADNLSTDSGAVYVFLRTETTWTQEAYVKASNTGWGDRFGSSVALSSDGTRLAVGASGESSRATGIGGDEVDNSAIDSGAVYVFSRTRTSWTQEAYVKSSFTREADYFGTFVSLSADGARLAVGARGEDSPATGINGDPVDDTATGSGAAYVFSRAGTTWTQEAYVKASNTGWGDAFGASGSLSGDGTRLAVGAYSEDSSATGIGGDQRNNGIIDSGAVYSFSWVGPTWTQDAYIKASNTGVRDSYGSSVSLSADGMRFAVGAHCEQSRATGIGGDQSDNSVSESGAAYVYAHGEP